MALYMESGDLGIWMWNPTWIGDGISLSIGRPTWFNACECRRACYLHNANQETIHIYQEMKLVFESYEWWRVETKKHAYMNVLNLLKDHKDEQSKNDQKKRLLKSLHKKAMLINLKNLISINATSFELRCQSLLGSGYHPILMNWNTNIDCCNWDGVTCDHFTGDVIDLDLSCGMLRGTIHPNTTLFDLPHLQRLNLAFNDLANSQLPRKIGNLSKSLTSLNISGCGFTGQIPSEISLLPKLVSLDLSWNGLVSLEPRIFNNLIQNSTLLRELLLHHVSISSSLPTFLNISSSLTTLVVGFTGLRGKLPDNIFNIQNLEELDMSGNEGITGPLPKVNISVISRLKRLGLSSTRLSGKIPYSIGHLNSLNTLHLRSCGLMGSLPKSLVNLRHLTTLDLADNMFNGTLPSFLFTLPSLEVIELSYNMFSGSLPSELFTQRSLKKLYLSHNQFDGRIDVLDQGSIRQTFQQLLNLTALDLSNNRFTDIGNNNFSGTIPHVCGEELKGLILNGNQFEGEVPSCFSESEQLEVLDLGNNRLNGEFPDQLGRLPNLKLLVLKANKFTGAIESSSMIENPFHSLRVLDLSQNEFGGHLPRKYFQSFDAMKNVVKDGKNTYLGLNVSISISRGFYSVVVVVKGQQLSFERISNDYTIVDLSSNNFEGEIPNEICSLNSLIVLNLSSNNLNGQIPHAIGNLSEIESLDLSGNQLTGKIPQGLADITTLGVLNLSQNHLVGRIPSGGQFNTFSTSFEGNSGLCGFPLPKHCEHPSTPPQLDADEDKEIGFTWEVVMLGFGCGTVLGLAIGYLMLSTGRPKWFNAIADEIEHMVQRRQNKRR
ncbi:hypothetical protein OSB04_026384 [Centaurea solstitialis]|uniref:Leucine-rich repeat-containing N-terminal plant-type domain-containing protein n=1 Tax=Centaurea solstitialis TaxID=347529 RepID=A0AA38SCL1_9ASTR|nr:hypothetical protein OSB04_026384 [Centaurea solstitialis]